MNKSFAALVAAGFAASFALTAVAQNTAPAAPATAAPADKHDHKHDAKKEKKTETAATAKAEVGKPAPNFTLKTTDGKDWSLADAAGKIVVLEWCNPECPVCKRVCSDGTVTKMMDETKKISSDVVFVFVNSSAARPSSLDGTAKYLSDNKLTVPALLDRDGKVGTMYGARTTPHCYVIDAKGVLRYQGAIDDNQAGNGAKMNYVVNAVKQIKANETVAPETTQPYGCGVKYAKN